MHILIILIFLCTLAGCDIFSTRNPEQPDLGKSSFIPPTEPSIVILNLETAFREKNIDSYMNCLYSDSENENNEFKFHASIDAQTQFPSTFTNWGSYEERRFLSSFFSDFSDDLYPSISWINKQPIQETADSAVYTSDYYLLAPGNDNSIPKEYAGRLQITMKHRNNGLYYISRWIDINVQTIDSVKNTFSILKGFYYN